MDSLQALVLGIVQGLTEFLPISSSAHLIIVPLLLGWPQPGLTFDMVLHLGTLTAVISYFLRDFVGMALALLRGLRAGRPLAEPQARLGLLLIIACLPAGIAGLLFDTAIEDRFYTESGLRQGLIVIGIAMIVLALLLLLAERVARHQCQLKDIGPRQALIVGLAQAVALIPGVSRSGSTITAGLFVGLTRPAAAEFSFLLGTPIILVAALKKIVDVLRGGIATSDLLPYAVGFLGAAVVGYLCITYLIRYLRAHSTTVFIVYRILVGVGLLLFAALR